MMKKVQKKICLLGAFAVGKTSLVKRFVDSIYGDEYLTTVGVKIDKKTIGVNDQLVKLMIWDLAGEDEFTDIRTAYLRGCAGGIVVVDGTRQKTAEVALKQITMLRTRYPEITLAVAVNKSDLEADWQIDYGEFVEKVGATANVTKTSAKSGDAVEQLFKELATQLVTNRSDAA